MIYSRTVLLKLILFIRCGISCDNDCSIIEHLWFELLLSTQCLAGSQTLSDLIYDPSDAMALSRHYIESTSIHSFSILGVYDDFTVKTTPLFCLNTCSLPILYFVTNPISNDCLINYWMSLLFIENFYS